MSEPSPDSVDFSSELARFSIFRGLPQSELRSIDAYLPPPLRPGVTIFRQGDVTSRIFLIKKGRIELTRKERNKPTLSRVVGPGHALGRLELDAIEGQLGTAKAISAVELLVVDIESLARLRTQHPELQSNFDRSDVIGHLRANPTFAPLADIEIKWISDIVDIDLGAPGDTIYKQGEYADDIIIIRQGRVRLEGAQKRWVSAGSVIGNQDILARSRRRSTAIVESKTHYYHLPKDDFLAIVQRHPRNDWKTSPIPVEVLLHRAPIFRNLTHAEIQMLAGYVMQVHYHRTHQPIVKAGKYDAYYYILARGAAIKQTPDEQGELLPSVTVARGASFGEGSLLFGDPATASVETLGATNWIRIHRQDFMLYTRDHPDASNRLVLPDDLRRRLDNYIYLGPWQRADEEVLFKKRRHWIVLLNHLSIVFLLLFVQFLLSGAFRFLFGFWPPLLLELLIAIFYTLPVGAWIVVDYLNDYHIITTRRIIHQEKVIMLKERRVTAPIDQIQNMNIERGIIARFLRYGDLVISTAATEGQINFDHLPNTNVAYDILVNEMTRITKFGLLEQQEMIRKQLQERLHLGLEERIDDRALLESTEVRKISTPRDLPFLRLLGLQQQEGNRLVWRRHWFGLVLTTLPAFITVLVVLFFLVFFTSSDRIHHNSQVPLVGVTALLFLISLFWLWWQWEDWENDRYIVSDQLIERITKKPLWFDEERTTLSIERVQNVEFRRPNPLAYLFNFGNVDIQTAATEGKVPFEFVPAPDDVQFEIYRRIENYQTNLEKKRQREQKNDFSEWLEAYHSLVTKDQTLHHNGDE